jgi:hypothetical protein
MGMKTPIIITFSAMTEERIGESVILLSRGAKFNPLERRSTLGNVISGGVHRLPAGVEMNVE